MDKLIGYVEDRQKLIDKFFAKTAETRFLRIIGHAGVGKSALARNTVNYML